MQTYLVTKNNICYFHANYSMKGKESQMCRFKSGIILKTRCVLSESDNDSHSDLLEQLNIKDTKENAMTKFVRAELIPPNNEWWTDTDTWEINIDQDILPTWFEEDREKYIQVFKESVKAWCAEHVLVDKKIDELKSGYYLLKRSEVKELLNDVKVSCDNSAITEMRENSAVTRMWNNSTVTVMYGNSTVTVMYGNSTVTKMYGNSTVTKMYGNSTVTRMYDNSTVTVMYGNSTVTKMCDNSTVTVMYGNSTVTKMCDNSTVTEMCDNSTVTEMCDNSTVTEMYDNSTVTVMYGNSTVTVMYGNSTVTKMYGNSTVTRMYGNSTVTEMCDNSIARDSKNRKVLVAGNYEVIRK